MGLPERVGHGPAATKANGDLRLHQMESAE